MSKREKYVYIVELNSTNYKAFGNYRKRFFVSVHIVSMLCTRNPNLYSNFGSTLDSREKIQELKNCHILMY